MNTHPTTIESVETQVRRWNLTRLMQVLKCLPTACPTAAPLFEGHVEFQENQRGISYGTLILPYLRGAAQITIIDPYIRQFHQARNLIELIEGIATAKDPAEEIHVKLITTENTEDEDKLRRQLEFLVKIKQAAAVAGISFDAAFDDSNPRPFDRHRHGLEDPPRPRTRHLPVRNR